MQLSKIQIYLLTLAFVLFALNVKVFAQEAKTSEPSEISKYKFNSIFGISQDDENVVYCLLGTDIFRAERSESADTIINMWILAHPKAKLIPISESVSKTKEGEEKFIYCWIIDQSENLNINLIEAGAFPGSTMIRPRNDKNKTTIKTAQLIEDNVYFDFLEKIKIAEKEAFEKKVGIWSSFIEKK